MELNGVALEKNRLAFAWGRFLAERGTDAVDQYVPDTAAQHSVMLHLPESLDKVITRNRALLSGYQDAAYADRYQAAVDRIRDRETRTAEQMAAHAGGKTLRLTAAVARNLAKLMAYKDEYEVARLYADPAYLDKLRAQFEGEPGKDYRLSFYLAPPLWAKRDENGHLKKQRFGQWMLPAFRVLAKGKRLRGTPFDVFGKTEERRHERALIDTYIDMVDRFCATLDAGRLETAIALAKLPDEIRGFGHVKERSMHETMAKYERLMAEYEAGGKVDGEGGGLHLHEAARGEATVNELNDQAIATTPH
jgi:indolepyruvate ferredoxin oxidoreductase